MKYRCDDFHAPRRSESGRFEAEGEAHSGAKETQVEEVGLGGGGESQEKKGGKKRKWREEERERRSREIRSQLETKGGKNEGEERAAEEVRGGAEGGGGRERETFRDADGLG